MSNKNFAMGFSLLEVMLVIVVIAALAALAIPGYQDYTQRARASEVLAKYDAVRSGVLADLSEGAIASCAKISEAIEPGNLQVDDVRLSVDYQSISNDHTQGYRPVLMVCAKADRQGGFGVGVAHAAHHEFSLSNKVEAGAVVTNSIVSFAVPLTMDNGASCYVPAAVKLTACGDPVATPSLPVVAAPKAPARAAVVAPTPLPVLKPPCAAPVAQTIDREVMSFGSDLTGYVMNNGDMDTGGDMTHLVVEVAIVGGQQVAASGDHGAAMLSYASHSDTNAFQIWNPASVGVWMGGKNYPTGVNINDGQNHRLTVSWESSSGALLVFDNGKQVYSGTAMQGGVIGGNGKLVLGQDQDSYGGGFATNDAFRGKIVAASMANAQVPADRISQGPLQTIVDKDNGLVTSVIMSPTGPVDTTGQHSYITGGSITKVTQQVDSGLYVSADCN